MKWGIEMIKDNTLKEMELFYDTGRLVTDACFTIKKLYRKVPYNVLYALNRVYNASDYLEAVLIMIGEGYDQEKHDYVTTLNEVPKVQYTETMKYVDGLLDNVTDAFEKGRVNKSDITESLNAALWRVNHSLQVLNKMNKM